MASILTSCKSINKPKNKGAIHHAILFIMPIKHNRMAALFAGPKMVTYGFTAACNNVFPAPPTNNANKKSGKLTTMADGTNKSMPNAIMIKATIMDFL